MSERATELLGMFRAEAAAAGIPRSCEQTHELTEACMRIAATEACITEIVRKHTAKRLRPTADDEERFG